MKRFVVLCLCGLSLALVASSKYSDQKYGVSFQYPKGYLHTVGDLGRHDKGLGYLGAIPMEFAAPGGVRVVTVETPDESYPGTDFTNAFFTVSVNQQVTQSGCAKFSDDVGGSLKPLVKTISGIQFQGIQQGSAAMNHQFGGTYYHGFANGMCYEFGYGIATSGYGVVDGIKRVDEKKVFAILEHILSSAEISEQKMKHP